MDCLNPPCPPDYVQGGNGSLTNTVTGTQTYETDGGIESDQILAPTSNVDYNSKDFILLEQGFSTFIGAELEVFIDGCPN